MGIGRFCCVGIPWILTGLSVALVLVGGLSGTTSMNTPLFTINTKNLSISVTDLSKLTDLSLTQIENLSGTIESSQVNLTASNLGLADSYSFYLFTFSSTTGTVTSKNASQFDYASHFNASTLTSVAAANGLTATIPKTVDEALNVFAKLMKYSEIVFIVACVAGGLTLLVGLLGFCSKMGSCCTYLISAITTLAMVGFGVLTTVTASTAVGVFTSFQHFGVSSSLGLTWLGLIWVGVLFGGAAGLFWLFSACCCSPDRKERRMKHLSTAGPEKPFDQPYGGYQRVHDPFMAPGQDSGIYQGSYPLHQVPHKSVAYEPYKSTV